MNKKKTYGGIVIDEFGYVLLRKPKGHYGGYVWTFPKGAPMPGESHQQTALRKVLEVGVEALIEEPIPGVYEGDTSITTYYLMSRVRETGCSDDKTETTRWVRFIGAPSCIRMTENLVGRYRDLAVFGAALQIRTELTQNGRLQPQVSPPPPGLEGICTCSLPLPAYCPTIEVSESCVAVRCPIALGQNCEEHDSLDKDDPRLIEAADILAERLVRDPESRKGVADYARELYVRESYPGSSLPKAVLFSIYKHEQFAYDGIALTRTGQAIFGGEETERWPGEGLARGPTSARMFEVYATRYEDKGP